MEEIRIDQIMTGLKRHIKFLAAMAIIGMMLFFIGTKLWILPQYESSTTMIVGKPTDYRNESPDMAYNQLMVNQKLVSTYSEIIRSRGIADIVIKNLRLNWNLKRYQEKVEVTTLNDTEIIQITVRDTIPKRARDIANETANIFKNQITNIMKIDNVKVLDYADLPKVAVFPNIFITTAIGFFGGLLLAIFITFIRVLNDTTIKDSDDVTIELGVPVLGIVPKMKEGELDEKK